LPGILPRCASSQKANSSILGFAVRCRTARLISVGDPAIGRSMSNRAPMRSRASLAIDDLCSDHSSKKPRRTWAQQPASQLADLVARRDRLGSCQPERNGPGPQLGTWPQRSQGARRWSALWQLSRPSAFASIASPAMGIGCHFGSDAGERMVPATTWLAKNEADAHAVYKQHCSIVPPHGAASWRRHQRSKERVGFIVKRALEFLSPLAQQVLDETTYSERRPRRFPWIELSGRR
jgi:hypothetical protein